MLENVSSEKVAYLIGYLAGDGCFLDGKNKRTDRLSTSCTDKEIFDWIVSNFEMSDVYHTKRGNNEALGIFATKDAYAKTFPTSYSQNFNKYGILCKKTERSLQNISKQNMKYWLLGLLDSDGMISWSIRKDRDRVAAKVNFTHPSIKLLEKVQTFIRDELNISSSIKPKGTENCFVLSFSKINDVKRFGDYIYSDKKAIVLFRKYEVYLSLLEQIVSRTNEGSMYPREFMQHPDYGSIVGTYSKYVFISPEGLEFPSAGKAADYYNLDKKTVSRNSRMHQKGWSSRLKTESEKEDFDKYVKRKIKQSFEKWIENNPNYLN